MDGVDTLKTPYPTAAVDRRALLVDLYAWNAANQRARDEYAAHPTAACPWVPTNKEQPCENLTDGIQLCPDHLADHRVCQRCKKVQPPKRHRYCDDCKLAIRGRCIHCKTRPAEKRRRQCSTCAHGGAKRLAAGRMRARRRGGEA